MADVFLSYRRTERDFVLRLRDALEAYKVSVWFDARLEAGESFNQEITREARGALAILVCWSPEAAKSDWVQAEALIGLEEGKLVATAIVPMDFADLPVPFNNKHSVELWDWVPGEPNAGFQTLLQRLGVLLKRRGLASFAQVEASIQELEPRAQIQALESWVTEYPDDPLAEDVWLRIEGLESQDSLRRIAEKKAKAAAAAEARKPKPEDPDELEARRDAAQGKAWRELGPSPPQESLENFVKTWKRGPLVDLAKRQLSDLSEKQDAGGEKNTSSMSYALGLLVVVAVAIVAWFGRASIIPVEDQADTAAWNFASDMNTVEAYEHYRERFPEGSYFDQALVASNELKSQQENIRRAADAAEAWAAAQASNSATGYAEFIERWPDSSFADDARDAIQEIMSEADERAWQEAQSLDTVRAYEDYKASQTNGAYLPAADAAIERIKLMDATRRQVAAAERSAWESARATNTIPAYRNFLSEFEASEYREVAKDRIRTLEAEAAALAAEENAQERLAEANRVVANFENVNGSGRCDQSFNVYFEFGSNAVTSQGAAVVNQAIANMEACNITGALVVGHSDRSGSRDQAFRTGSQRANAIQSALSARGVSRSSISTTSFGEERPVKATADGVREPLNRRVEIMLKGTPRLPPYSLDALHPDVRTAVARVRGIEVATADAVAKAEEAARLAEEWAVKSRQSPRPRDTVFMNQTWTTTINDETVTMPGECRGALSGVPLYRTVVFSGVSEGDVNAGEMSACSPNGYAIMVFSENERNRSSNGSKAWEYAKGQFKMGSRHGLVEYLWTNGTKMTGEWQDDEFTGYGVHTLSYGAKREGQFKNGKLDGLGAIWSSRGTVSSQGRYEAGRLVQSLDAD